MKAESFTGSERTEFHFPGSISGSRSSKSSRIYILFQVHKLTAQISASRTPSAHSILGCRLPRRSPSRSRFRVSPPLVGDLCCIFVIISHIFWLFGDVGRSWVFVCFFKKVLVLVVWDSNSSFRARCVTNTSCTQWNCRISLANWVEKDE